VAALWAANFFCGCILFGTYNVRFTYLSQGELCTGSLPSKLGGIMGRFREVAGLLLVILAGASLCSAQKKSITIVLKDGHQKTFSTADVSRIEFKNDAMIVNHDGRQESIPLANVVRMDFGGTTSTAQPFGRNHFIGKWKVWEGPDQSSFIITLAPNGEATKSHGAPHGTWALVDGEAHISWDDGWHDVIKKVGDGHEKFAYEPGRPLTDPPSNVTSAVNLNDQSM